VKNTLPATIEMKLLFILLAAVNSYKFNRLALLPEGLCSPDVGLLTADTDHNGLDELIFDYPGPGYTWVIYEYRPINQYERVYEYHTGNDTNFSFQTDVADGDGDGLFEILGELYTPKAEIKSRGAIFESPNFNSFPTSLVWVYPEEKVGLKFMDLDNDAKTDIFSVWTDWSHLPPTSWMAFYENRGDNSYIPVWECSSSTGVYHACAYVFGDFDKDGVQEFAEVNPDTSYIWKCTGDDDYKIVWSHYHYKINVYDAWLGNDTDGDGKPEIFMKNYWYGPNPEAVLTMYEATGVNTYKLVEIDTVDAGDPLEGASCCGDVDGDGVEEVILSLGTYVVIYKATGDDKYEKVWVWDNDMGHAPEWGYQAKVACHDFNKNGYNELIISGNGQTSIFEIDKASIPENIKSKHPVVAHLSVVPTIIKNSALIKYSIPRDCRVELTAYDAAGRAVKKLVDKELKAGTYAVTWTAKELPTGVYFIRLKTATSGMTEKVIITK
jgi:hypothetical protein